MMHFRIHPEATLEIEAAGEWYGEQVPALAIELARDLDVMIDWIVEKPRMYPLVEDGPDEVECRNCGHVGRFPYRLIYAVFGDEVLFLALAHHHRRPGYWRDRLLDS